MLSPFVYPVTSYSIYRSIHLTASSCVQDYYRILGVHRTATAQQIKTAYYAKAKVHHPDTNKSDAEAARNFREISEAYEILSDTSKRRVYDATVGPSQQPSSPFTGSSSFRSRKPDQPKPLEKISRNHLKHVYRTLNRDDIDIEEPKFRPFEEHHYDNGNSFYNRFEYSRTWDPVRKGWIYKKRSTAGEYQKQMEIKFGRLSSIVSVFTACALLFVIYNNFT